MSPEHATCRSCKAEIVFVETVKGHRIPIDPAPVAGGNIEIKADVAHMVLPDAGKKRHVSHFATCPNSAAHRKKSAARSGEHGRAES